MSNQPWQPYYNKCKIKCLLCAHSTGENPSILIRGAVEAIGITVAQYVVKQSTISITTTVFNDLRVNINTIERWPIMATRYLARFICTLWWEVAIILPGSCWRALDFSWNHKNWRSSRSIADCAGNVMVECIAIRASTVLVLSTVDMWWSWYSIINVGSIGKVFWLVWQTEFLYSSSLNIPKCPSSSSRIDQLGSSDIRTSSSSPSDISYTCTCTDKPHTTYYGNLA